MNINLASSILTQRGNTELAARMLQKFISREDQIGQAVSPISVRVLGKDEILKRLEKHLSGEIRLDFITYYLTARFDGLWWSLRSTDREKSMIHGTP